MNRVITLIGLIGLCSVLAGCAGMNSDFDCHEVGGRGAGCVSLNQVNRLADSGYFTHRENPAVIADQTATSQAARTQFAQAGKPLRTNESIQRVWVAPFVDSHDNYHAASTVYTVMTPSHWLGHPVTLIRQSGKELG